MIGVTGFRSTIIKELSKFDDITRMDLYADLPDTNKFVLAAGAMEGKKIIDQSEKEIEVTFHINLFNPVRLCEIILDEIPDARICLVGSESGFKGSFDMAYAMSKSALHFYSSIRCKSLKPNQRLFTVAPHIIFDSAMTMRRHDYADIVKRNNQKPFITAKEVAQTIWDGLNNGANEIIRFN